MSTIKDVAKRAGVSTGTVSMVLNNNPSVKLETRIRVMEVIKELNYIPNQYARGLVTKKKNVIGIVRAMVTEGTDGYRPGYRFDELSDTFFLEMLDVIVKETALLGYSLLIDSIVWSSNADPQKGPFPRFFESERVDGILWVGGFMTSTQKQMLSQLDIPVVTIGSRFEDFDWVDTDPEEGMYLITKHVISLGHKKIAFINGLENTQTSKRKMAGVIRALDEAGIELPEENKTIAPFSGLGGYNAMKRIWQRGVRPTAVLTALDNMAVGVMRFLFEQGLNIPEDISVTGYDEGLLSEHFYPMLTSVCTKKNELGLQGSRILVNRIKNSKAKPVRLIVPPEIKLGGSVKSVAINPENEEGDEM